MNRICIALVALLMLLPTLVHAQGAKYSDYTIDQFGHAVGFVQVQVCATTTPANPPPTSPCSPIASLFTDQTLTFAAPNPLTSDAVGNFSFYASPGFYILQFYPSGVTGPLAYAQTVQVGGSAGGGGAGTVTNVSSTSSLLTVANPTTTPAITPVILGTGTKLATTSASAPASNKCVEFDTNGNLVVAVSNAACGAGGGAVSSVFTRTGAVVAANGDYTAAQVTNALDVTTTHLANQFYAGPTSGGALAPSWRLIVAADVPTLNQSTTGNAATASALAALGTSCAAGNYARGIDVSGNATGCTLASGGGGTVTSFSAGNLSPLFTTSVATATTTPALTFSLSTAAAHTFFGNNTAGTAAPGFQSIGVGDLPGSGALTVNTSAPLGGGGSVALGASLTLTCTTCLTSVTAHNLLSATHGDTTAAAVVRGDVITGQTATPKWQRLALGGNNLYLKSNATDLIYSTLAAAGVGACTNGMVVTLNADAVPTCTTADTTTTHALFATAGAPAFRAIASGDIPTLNQNTTGTAATITGALALANTPLTTLGDLLYVNVTPALARLAGQTTSTKEYLSQTGTGTVSAAPTWAQVAYADLSGTPQLPVTKAAVASNWLNSYTSSTGLFTATQPAFTDISGTATSGQIPATVVYNNQANTYSGGGLQDLHSMKLKPPTATVSTLPAASSNTNVVYEVTDGASASDCVTGSGTTQVWCVSTGTVWTTIGDGGSGGGGSGTVTSIATTSPITGGTITTTGTIACATCVTSAASLTSNALVVGAGSQASAVLGSLGTTTTVLHGNAASTPSFGPVVQGDVTSGYVDLSSNQSVAGQKTFTAWLQTPQAYFTGQPWFDVTAPTYGATGNEKDIDNQSLPWLGSCSITSGTATLTCTNATFVSGDVNKIIYVYCAGSSVAGQQNCVPLVTTIQTFTDATHVTLAANATSTVANVAAYYGTDDRAAIQSAMDACHTAGGGTVYFPKGNYLIGSYGSQALVRFYGINFYSNCNLIGQGITSAIIEGAAMPDNLRLLSSDSSDCTTFACNHIVFNTVFSNFVHDNRAAWQPSFNSPSTTSSSSTVGVSCVFCEYHWEQNVIGKDSKASPNAVLSTVTGNGTTATATTATCTNYAQGQWVSITGVTGLTGFNTAAVQIASIVSCTQFTYLNATNGTGTTGSATVNAVTSGGATDSEGATTDFFFSSYGYYWFDEGIGTTKQSGGPFSATSSSDIYYFGNLMYGASFWQGAADHGSRNLHFSHNHAFGNFQRDFSLESSSNATYDGDVSGESSAASVSSGAVPPGSVLGGMTIARSGSGTGTTSATVSRTNPFDLKVVFAYNNSSTTVPTLPAGWTSITTQASATTAVRVGCNVSSSGSDTASGTWTNATNVVILSYSGTSVDSTADCNTTGIGNSAASFAAASTTASYPTITVKSGLDWVDGFLADSASSLCTPAGMTTVTSVSTIRASDTNAPVASWPTTTCSVSSSTWITVVVEVAAINQAANGFLSNNATNVTMYGITSSNHTQCGVNHQNSNGFQITMGTFLSNVSAPICISGNSDRGSITSNTSVGNGNTDQPLNTATGTQISVMANTPIATSGSFSGNHLVGGLEAEIQSSGRFGDLCWHDAAAGVCMYYDMFGGVLRGLSNSGALLETHDQNGNYGTLGTVSTGASPPVITAGTGSFALGTEGTEPSSVPSGTSGIVDDSTLHCPVGWFNGVNEGCVLTTAASQIQSGENSIVADSAGINTTETVIVKSVAAMPANRLTAGTVIRAVLEGTCTSSAANISTFAIRIGTAGTTSDAIVLSAPTSVAATTGTAIPFRALLTLTVRTTGASATASGFLTVTNQGTTGIIATATNVVLPTMTTFSTTTANFIDVTYKAAASTTTSTFKDAYIDVVVK